MNFKQDEIDLTTRFATEFPSMYPQAVVDYVGMNTAVPDLSDFVRFRVKPVTSVLIGGGGSTQRYRNYGSVLIQIFAPQGQGSGHVMTIADDISSLFRRFKTSTLRCRTPSVDGVREEGKHLILTVQVPYEATHHG